MLFPPKDLQLQPTAVQQDNLINHPRMLNVRRKARCSRFHFPHLCEGHVFLSLKARAPQFSTLLMQFKKRKNKSATFFRSDPDILHHYTSDRLSHVCTGQRL